MAAFCVGLNVLRNYEISWALIKKIAFQNSYPTQQPRSMTTIPFVYPVPVASIQ